MEMPDSSILGVLSLVIMNVDILLVVRKKNSRVSVEDVILGCLGGIMIKEEKLL